MALGSDSLREVISNMETNKTTAVDTDSKILEKMSFLGAKINEL